MSHRQASTSGTFSAKMTRQESVSTSSPPSGGPTAIAALVPAVHEPIAAARSLAPEDRGDDRQRARHEQRAERRPAAPRAAISSSTDGRDRADERGDAEAGRADREDPPPAVEVAERAADEDQRREQQQVGLDDPLLVGERRVEVVAQRGQRDVDDRLVDEHDRRPEDAGDQRQPLRAGLVHRRWRSQRAARRRSIRPIAPPSEQHAGADADDRDERRCRRRARPPGLQRGRARGGAPRQLGVRPRSASAHALAAAPCACFADDRRRCPVPAAARGVDALAEQRRGLRARRRAGASWPPAGGRSRPAARTPCRSASRGRRRSRRPGRRPPAPSAPAAQ